MAMFTSSKAGGYGRPRYRRHDRRVGFITVAGALVALAARKGRKG